MQRDSPAQEPHPLPKSIHCRHSVIRSFSSISCISILSVAVVVVVAAAAVVGGTGGVIRRGIGDLEVETRVVVRDSSGSEEKNMDKSKGLGLLSKLGFGSSHASATGGSGGDVYNSVALGPDTDVPEAGQRLAMFGAGCFWGVELAFQRLHGVVKTEVGYSQGKLHKPTYENVCEGDTGHVEVVRIHYDPNSCSYEDLLGLFWSRHDPTTLNRQGGDVGTQYRSGIYYYSPEQEQAARQSMEKHAEKMNRKIVTEILPAKKFYRAEEYHQQYLAKGGRNGSAQSCAKGCNDPIRCYG